MDSWSLKDNRENFSFKLTNPSEIIKLVNKMEHIKSAGHDNLNATVIKHSILHLAGPIAHTINLSITNSKFPARWKIGKILPLHKGKGLSQLEPSSFCPISLLPTISKITERVLQIQIMDYMISSEQLNNNHHSYRAGHSTSTAMLQLSNMIFEGMNDNLITTLVTIDQSSAFNVINHRTLIRKLKIYNFSDETVSWISSYLSHRSQYVSVGTKQSAYWMVNQGVPPCSHQ